MVTVPTLERKYYDNQTKVNTMGAYASELYNAFGGAVNTYKQIKTDQEKVKMDSFSTSAELELKALTNQWRLDNQSDPNNKQALNDLSMKYDDIFNKYSSQIDPIAKAQWDGVVRKMKGQLDISNQDWAFKQNQVNAENYIKQSMSNYYSIFNAQGYDNDLEGFLTRLGEGYNQLLDNGARTLGTEVAANTLNDFETNGVKSFINGVASRDPAQALELMKDERVIKMLGASAAGEQNKMLKAQLQHFKLNEQLQDMNLEISVSNELSKAADPMTKLSILEKNKGILRDKAYKRFESGIYASMGITQEKRDIAEKEIKQRIKYISSDAFSSNTEKVQELFSIKNDLDERYGTGLFPDQIYSELQSSISENVNKFAANSVKKEEFKGVGFWGFTYTQEDIDKEFEDLGKYKGMAQVDVVKFLGSEEYKNSKNQKQDLKDYVNKTKTFYTNELIQTSLGQQYKIYDGNIPDSIRAGDVVIREGKMYQFIGGNIKDAKNYKEIR